VGAQQYELCGVIRWRARYVVIASFIVLSPIFLKAGVFFIAMGLDESTSRQAELYLQSQMPAVFILGLLDVDRNFLACFNRTDIAMYC